MAKAQYIFFDKLQNGLKSSSTQKPIEKPIEKPTDQSSFDFFCSEISKLFEPIESKPQQLSEPSL